MTDRPTGTAAVALRRRREETIRVLCDHFAADHLEAEELESLIDAAHAATGIAELDALVNDLPELPSAAGAPGEGVHIAPHGAAQEHGTVLALMGGVERKGRWTPARNTYVVALMGGVVLDFREAVLDPGITEVYVLALMGGVEIIVPPGLHVDSSGIGIMGGFEHGSGSGARSDRTGPVVRGGAEQQGGRRFPVDSSAPVLRVIGAGVMGGVEIVERRQGETAGDAKRRLKGERR